MRLYTLSLLYFAFPALSLVTTQLSNGFNNYSYSTGVTRHFLLNISSGIVEPDGTPHFLYHLEFRSAENTGNRKAFLVTGFWSTGQPLARLFMWKKVTR